MRSRIPPAATALLMILAGAGADGPRAPQDYREMVRITQWSWKEEETTILTSLSRASSPFDVVVIRPHDKSLALRFKILDGQREVYSWWGHRYSVFALLDDRLFYVNFDIAAPGGTVVAVDLKTGKEVWQSQLEAVGVYPHSFYSNYMNINANADTISVFGKETMGRYYELKDARTGETIGHKVFKERVEGQR